jgi:hypothetical protein
MRLLQQQGKCCKRATRRTELGKCVEISIWHWEIVPFDQVVQAGHEGRASRVDAIYNAHVGSAQGGT